jgi:hypothetical protein
MLKSLWINLIIIANMSFMLIELSLSSEPANNDPLKQSGEPHEEFILDQGTKNSTSKVSEPHYYGMGYELRVKIAKQRAEAERLSKIQHPERPFHSDRPERPFRPERPGRPERPNRPGR